jgi:hypothetical protein
MVMTLVGSSVIEMTRGPINFAMLIGIEVSSSRLHGQTIVVNIKKWTIVLTQTRTDVTIGTSGTAPIAEMSESDESERYIESESKLSAEVEVGLFVRFEEV